MRTRVKVESTYFNVDTVNRVVVCVLGCDMNLYSHPAYYSMDTDAFKKRTPVNWDGKFTVKAIARCAPQDTFDETTGKRIAESRAKAKMYRISAKVYSLLREHMFRCAGELDKSCTACLKAEMMENNHVMELKDGKAD